MKNEKAPVSEELVGELLQGVLDEMKTLKASMGKVASEEALTAVAKMVSSLEEKVNRAPSTAPAATEYTKLVEELKQLLRQRPEYKLSQYVRYGGYMFGLMVVLVAGLTWLALDWKGERDRFREAYWTADWRVRYVKQQDPGFYSYIEGLFSKDPAGVSKWVVEQEQADEKRALASQAAEQAKALAEQANQLEGRGRVKTKKKG